MNKEEMYTLLENNLIEYSIDFLKQANINITEEEAKKLFKKKYVKEIEKDLTEN
jgi:Holliday junction resolvasome RuvABC DNA-binding subunit